MRAGIVIFLIAMLTGCGANFFPDSSTPTDFNFLPKADVDRSVWVESDPVTPSGYSDVASISVTNGEYSVAGGPFTSKPGSISPGQTLVVRVMSSSQYGTATKMAISVGKYATTFIAVTAPIITTPDQFDFISPTVHLPFGLYSSNAVTITFVNYSTHVDIAGDGDYSIDGGDRTTDGYIIRPNQSVKIFHDMTETRTYASTLTIGGVFSSYSTTCNGTGSLLRKPVRSRRLSRSAHVGR